MALRSVQLVPLLADIYAGYKQLYLDHGRRGDLLFGLFCMHLSKESFVWDILLDRNKDLKQYSSPLGMLLQLLLYARAQHMRQQRRPLFAIAQVHMVLNSSHLSAREVIHRLGCIWSDARQTRIPSIQLQVPELKPKRLQVGTSGEWKGAPQSLRRLGTLDLGQVGLKAADFLYASEIKELYHFLEVCRLVQAESKRSTRRSSPTPRSSTSWSKPA